MKTYKKLKYSDDYTICYGPVTNVYYPHFHKNTKIIAENAFRNSTVRILKFPKNLEEIKETSFSGCCDIRKLVFSNSIKIIRENAFFVTMIRQNTIKLPDSLEFLEQNALSHQRFDRVILPDNIERLYGLPFGRYKFKNEGKFYSCFNGDIYSKDFSILYKKGSNLPIKEGCKVIKKNAFSSFYDNKTIITLPESVERIESNSFYNTVLNTLILPKNKNLQIMPYAFENMQCENALVINDNISTSCENISQILNKVRAKIEINSKDFCIEKGVIYNADKTKLIFYPCAKEDKFFAIPNSVKEIASFAFDTNKFLESILVDSKYVTTFNMYSFKNCNNLENFSFKTPVILNEYMIGGFVKIKEIDLPKNSFIKGNLTVNYTEKSKNIKILVYEEDYKNFPHKTFLENEYEIKIKDVGYYLDKGASFKEINKMFSKNCI